METLDTAGCGLEKENSSSNHEIEVKLEDSIRQMLKNLPQQSPPAENCIFRVPRKLRQLNEAAYTPQMVSIGPLHRGEEHLKGMEEKKKRYLDEFLHRETINLEDCVKMIKNWEKRIRNCYAESIKLSSDEFVKMILIDSSFIIEAMVEYQLNYFLEFDLLLLENQLPFFVLEGLFNLAFGFQSQNTFLQLSVKHFKFCCITNHNPDLKQITSSDVRHFNDLLRIYHAPLAQRSVPTGSVVEFARIQNATTLHKTGVEFKVSSNCMLDIRFDKGVLEIPQLRVDEKTEHVLRNIIALEWYLHHWNSYIIDYICFMDNLIDTPEDVEILEKNGILLNWLSDRSAVSNLFNNLATDVPMASSNYYLYGIANDLNLYCKVPWHDWKATLQRDYFSTPWRVASTVAAILLLVLTFIQTICSIISL